MDAALLDEAEEGPRMAKLREVVGKALTAAARGVKPAMLAEALPDVAAKDGKLLDALREEAVAAIGASTEAEFDALVAERGVVAKLNALDDLLLSLPADLEDQRVVLCVARFELLRVAVAHALVFVPVRPRASPAAASERPLQAMLRLRVRRKRDEVRALEGMLATLEQDNDELDSELRALNERALLCQTQLRRKAEAMTAALAVATEFAPEDD